MGVVGVGGMLTLNHEFLCMWVEVMLDICVVADKRASAGCTSPPQNRGGLLGFPGNEASRVRTC